MEGAGIFAPSLIGLPLDVAIMARDVYNDTYGTPENRFPFESHLASDPKGTNARMAKIVTMVKKQMGLGKNGSKNLGQSPGAMGGSILGTKSIYSFLKRKIRKKVFFFDILVQF